MSDDSLTENQYRCRKLFLGSTFSCLASAIAFIHTKTTRHMDIKPHNILVRKICEPSKDDKPGAYWRIYLSDFGLSRCFATNDHSQTDGPTSRTPKYCAPEVFMYESRGRSSDIFSLGCVYAEILTTYAGHHPNSFSDYIRNDDGDESFHLNISKVGAWFDLISVGWVRIQVVATIIKKMLSVDSQFRPTAAEVAASIPLCTWLPVCSCVQQPEPYVAYSEPSPPISDSCKDPLPRVKSSEQRG
jgi:serine/threonine protein kinase